MSRQPNKTPPDKPGVVLFFEPHEFKFLQHNSPGPSGVIGGYGREENWLLDNTDSETLRCALDAVHFERICRYCKNYGSGGPNARIRAACIPALRRAGIELLPEWRTPAPCQ